MEGLTFQLGPLPTRIEGDHRAVRWGRRVYEHLACDAEPVLTFTFVDRPLDLGGPEVVGDSKNKVGPGELFCRVKHFDVRVSRRGDRLAVELYQRDRRSLFVRSLVKPEEAWKMWLSHGLSVDTHLLKTFAYTVCPFVMQCALLERGAALIHAGGIELDGRAVLLPAWGGAGKSTAVSRAVLHGRGRFLADDQAVVGRDGQLHLHLLPIHAYAFHARQDPVLRQRLLAGLSPVARRQWRFANVVRPKRAVRWIRPQDLFGVDKLARRAQLEQVVVMFRADRDGFRFERISAAEAARPCVGVIVEEVNDFADRLALAGAGWAPTILPDLADACRSLVETYTAAFSQADCARLLVPRRADGDALAAFLQQHVPLLAEATA